MLDAPFSDLTVLELASVLAGPSVGQFFAELGATVLKVENPRTGGDVTRRWLLPSEDPADDRPAYFTAINWGKLSVALDLTHPDGQALLHRLIPGVDVVVSSYRPGQAEGLGADAATLRRINPRLIVAEVTGYGAEDPRPGYDAVIQAETGFTYLNGEPDARPVKMPVALMDILAAHHLKEAVLVALLGRARTDEGAHVSVSLRDAGIASLANQATNWLTAGVSPQRMGSAHPNIAPYGTPYATADGDIVLAVGTDRQFAALCAVLGLDGLAQDDRFATNGARVQHRAALDRLLDEALASWEREALLATLADQGVPSGAIRDLPTVFAQPDTDRQLLHDASTGLHAVRTVAFGPGRPLAPPPRFGADTRAVLGQRLGLSQAEIEGLASDGVIGETN